MKIGLVSFLIYLWESNNKHIWSDLSQWSHDVLRENQNQIILCYNEVMFNRLMLLLSLISVVVILAMINFTTPTGVGPLGVLVFFMMVYVVVFGIVNLMVVGFIKLMGYRQEARKEHYYAAMIAFGPVMLLLIRSFGSLNLATIGMTAVFIALGCFVINKRL